MLYIIEIECIPYKFFFKCLKYCISSNAMHKEDNERIVFICNWQRCQNFSNQIQECSGICISYSFIRNESWQDILNILNFDKIKINPVGLFAVFSVFLGAKPSLQITLSVCPSFVHLHILIILCISILFRFDLVLMSHPFACLGPSTLERSSTR